MKNTKWAYHLLAFAVMSIWGVTFIFTKLLLFAGLTPIQIFFFRFLIAYVGIWPICLWGGDIGAKKLLSCNWKDELLFLFLGVTGGSLYFYTENTALAHTQACNVSFIVSSAPVFTVILTLIAAKVLHGPLSDGLEKVRVRWRMVFGTILCLLGMAGVLFGNEVKAAPAFMSLLSGGVEGLAAESSGRMGVDGVAGLGGGMPVGELFAIGASLCWALYSVFMAQMTSKYGAFFATRKVFFWGVVTILPFVVGAFPRAEVFSGRGVVAILLMLSLVASLGCFVLWNKVMKELGNVTATNYVYLNPFFTLWAAYLFLDESMTVITAIGSVAIIVGVILTTRNGKESL